MRPTGKAWLELFISGQLWKIYVLHPDDCDDLDGREGVTVHARCAIYLDERLPYTRLISVLFHELIHACVTNDNDESLSAIFGCPESDVTKANERIACFFGPKLADMFMRANLMRLPK